MFKNQIIKEKVHAINIVTPKNQQVKKQPHLLIDTKDDKLNNPDKLKTVFFQGTGSDANYKFTPSNKKIRIGEYFTKETYEQRSKTPVLSEKYKSSAQKNKHNSELHGSPHANFIDDLEIMNRNYDV